MKDDNNRIKDLRKAKKMTQVELAQALGVTQGTIQKLETNQVALDTKWMRRIAEILEIEPYELLPLDMQPQSITPEEMEVLRAIRKSFNNRPREDNKDVQNEKDIPNVPAQQNQPPQKSNER